MFGGVALRADGPSAPPNPRYPNRTLMLFGLVEILSQAYAQLASPQYRDFQGRPSSPRVLSQFAVTFPSGMSDAEKSVYNTLISNAVILTSYLLNIPDARRPNWDAAAKVFTPFLLVDEALAAQMVYVYQEIQERFSGSMEEFSALYGRASRVDPTAAKVAAPTGQAAPTPTHALRVASIDVGGGTTDVLVADYTDFSVGTGTSLEVKKLFQDGINIAGDELCRALIERVLWSQILPQIPGDVGKLALSDMFGKGDAGLGAAWRTLREKLVANFWLPLSRALWGMAEGFEVEGHVDGKVYTLSDVVRIFGTSTPQAVVLDEADRLIATRVKEFPGLRNLMFRLDRKASEDAVAAVLTEPLRRYADVLAQFDVDIVLLAGRAARINKIRDILLAELPVAPARLVSLANYRVGDWYPSKWRELGRLRDPKSTVCAGAAIYLQAARNKIPGFSIERIIEQKREPIFGLYHEREPQVPHEHELFPEGQRESKLFPYGPGMRIGFRQVASETMDASPLFEVVPSSAAVEARLLEERVALSFGRDEAGQLRIAQVVSKNAAGPGALTAADLALRLKTLKEVRYWLDTGVFTTPTLQLKDGKDGAA
jgi:hypothetical protein